MAAKVTIGHKREQQVIDLISYSVENFKEIEFKDFDKIELINKNIQGNKIPVAIIDKDFFPSIEGKFFKPEHLVKSDIIEIDEEPKEYSIQVYSLNKETGMARVYLHEKGGIYKASLYLKGKDNYQNTIFTKNMDEKEPTIIQIKAIGTRVNNSISNLTYTF